MRRLLIILLLAGCCRVPPEPEPEPEPVVETYPPYWPVITTAMKDMHDWFWWMREEPYLSQEH